MLEINYYIVEKYFFRIRLGQKRWFVNILEFKEYGFFQYLNYKKLVIFQKLELKLIDNWMRDVGKDIFY